MLADVRKTLNDQQLELRMPSAMAPILQTLHGKQGDLTVRNENSRLRSLGSAVNSDLESVAARIGRLNQSYRIPALRINGNGVQGTSHSDQEDEGTTLRMDSKRSTGGVFGESPSEIRQLRQELRQLSDEVARLKSLIQKTDL